MKKYIVAGLVLVSCALARAPQGASCEHVVCPTGHHCIVAFGEATCVASPVDVGLCDMECPWGQQCRFGQCIAGDLDGPVCEFDDACRSGWLCIANHCTQLECEPGDTMPCYTGSPGTAGVGQCVPGVHVCGPGGTYQQDCLGQIVDRPEEGLLACNGLDDDCDGERDLGTLRDVDIVLVFDVSGSMHPHMEAVSDALPMVVQMYDHAGIRFALVFIPGQESPYKYPTVAVPLLPYRAYRTKMQIALAGLRPRGSLEASWDVIYLVARDELEGLRLRPEAKTVIVMFTDEVGQSYLDHDGDEACRYESLEDRTVCDLTEADMCEAVARNDVGLYTVTDMIDPQRSFDDCGETYGLSADPREMAERLEGIVEHVCEQ